MVILDTCALLWWAFEPEKLSSDASLAIHGAYSKGETVAVSAISVWECGIKMKKKHLSLPLSLEAFVEKLKSLSNFEFIPVDESIWLESVLLEWEHKDPADRAIVATAKLCHASLITKDQPILEFYHEAIW